MVVAPLLRFVLCSVCLVAPAAALAAAGPYASTAQSTRTADNPHGLEVGQRVEGWITAEWMPVTLLQIGGGPNPGYPFLVAVGEPIRGIQPKRWLAARDVRPLSKPAPDTSAAGPRLGRYIILSYGANPAAPLRLGEIELLAGGSYRFLNVNGRVLGSGKYTFDPAAKNVVWQDGILKEQRWTGTFTVEREGKTHQIRLMRTTTATNSTDSGRGRR